MNVPPINLIQNRIGSCPPMFEFKILTCPLNEVVLEYALDKLVKDIRGYKFINICAREVVCERLVGQVRKTGM